MQRKKIENKKWARPVLTSLVRLEHSPESVLGGCKASQSPYGPEGTYIACNANLTGPLACMSPCNANSFDLS